MRRDTAASVVVSACIIVGALWIGWCVTGCIPTAARTPRVDLSLAQQERQAVRIEIYCSGYLDGEIAIAPSSVSSGGIVTSRHVLTARHVFDACPGMIPGLIATVPGDRQRYRMAWYRWLDGDQVLLERADAGSWSWAQRPRTAQVMPGDRICAETASPLRARRCGDVRARYVHEPGVPGVFVHYEADTAPGNSGSLLWDARGRLVGTHARHQPFTTRALMVPVDWRHLP